MERRKGARLKALEDGLAAQLAEMKVELSEQDLVLAAASGSSLGRLKTAEEYIRDRDHSLQQLLLVPGPTSPSSPSSSQQHSVMAEGCGLALKPGHTPENLPLLLHQFYCQRVGQLVQLRHTLMVRWARFAVGQTSVSERLNPHFQRIMEFTLSEYNDALNRSRRLAVSCDRQLADKTPPTHLVNEDDVIIYLKWLVHQQRTTRDLTAFISSALAVPLLFHSELMQAAAVRSQAPPTSGPRPHPPTTTTHAPLTTTQSRWLTLNKSLAAISRLKSLSHSSQVSQAIASSSGGVASSGHVTSHVTMPSTLQGTGMGPAKLRFDSVPEVPRHVIDVELLQSSLQELMTLYSISGSSHIHSVSEHLQLYYQSMRKFRSHFQQQEASLSLLTYDQPPQTTASQTQTGSKRHTSRLAAYRKKATWLPYVKLRPTFDPRQVEAWAAIEESVGDYIDPLLSLSCHCSHLHSSQRVLYALKQHCVAVRHPSPLTGDHMTSHDFLLVWKCIYSGLDSRKPLDADDSREDASDLEVGVAIGGRGTPFANEPQIEVLEAVKLLGNEQGRKISSKASDVPKDGYFAFLLLRHIKIRDTRIKCLSILNYFRSVERTLTINHVGLSLAPPAPPSSSSFAGASLDHRHLFNTPADFVVNETEFMQFSEVENHDDFYSFTSDYHVKVWDQRGKTIVYDEALNDLGKLEKELLTLGTYYIMRGAAKTGKTGSGEGGGGGVDRFEVLADLWSSEAAYLEAKLKVINAYLEAYHHVISRPDRARLGGVVTTLLKTRPLQHPGAAYFTHSYQAEGRGLACHLQLVEALSRSQLTRERENNMTLHDHLSRADTPSPSFGLPHPLVAETLVCLSGDRRPQTSGCYLLETCPSLSPLSSLSLLLARTLSETLSALPSPPSPHQVLAVRHKLLELLLAQWEGKRALGAGYTTDTEHNLFVGVCADNPSMWAELCVAHGNRAGGGAEVGGDPKEQKRLRLQAWCEVLEAVTLRDHMTVTCSECEVLTRLYKQQLKQLEREECHAHLRCVNFDLSLRLPSGSLDDYITRASESAGEASLDRYVPAQLKLAVCELDEKHLGHFSFRTREAIAKLLGARNGLQDLRVSLLAQLAHRNSLLVASQHNASLLRHTLPSSSSAAAVAAAASPDPPPKQQQQPVWLKRSFVSLQLLKTPVRDHMLSVFTKHPPSNLRSSEDLERAKCDLITDFSLNLTKSLAHVSLRNQIILVYASLARLLADFPATRDAYFTLGRPVNEAATPDPHYLQAPSRQTLSRQTLSRQALSRPPVLLSADGCTLLNLWYLPHFSEVLAWHSGLDIAACQQALSTALVLVSSLHVLLQYMCAYVRLGSHTPLTGERRELGGKWGGTEGIGSQLLQLQADISGLDDPIDPSLVSKLLLARCRLAHLQHRVVVSHHLPRSLLATGNTSAVQKLDVISAPLLNELCRPMTSPVPRPFHCQVPHPLRPLSDAAKSLCPWGHYQSAHGPFPGWLDHMTRESVGTIVFASLAVLTDSDRAIAHGEFLGMKLLLDDVLQTSPLAQQDVSLPQPPPLTPSPLTPSSRPKMPSAPLQRNSLSVPTGQQGMASGLGVSPSTSTGTHLRASRPRHSSAFTALTTPTTLTTLTSLQLHVPPLEGVELLEKFLRITSQLEALKTEWEGRVMVVADDDPMKRAKQFDNIYREKVLVFARKMVAKQQARDLLKQQMENETLDAESEATFMTEPTTASSGPAPSLSDDEEEWVGPGNGYQEISLRTAQVERLLELLEGHMIRDTVKHLTKLHQLLLSERERDDTTTLPLDLWRTSAMNFKESASIPRSHVVEHFTAELLSAASDQGGDSLCISKSAMKQCLQQLSSGVLAREKECYRLYGAYYEGVLRSQYSQLHHKDQEIERYQRLSEANSSLSREDAVGFLAENTHSLLMEITALRSKVLELNKELQSQVHAVRAGVRQECTALVERLFSATLAVKNKFEDYRYNLYSDVTQSLQEVRESTAESVAKMKEKLANQHGNPTGGVVAMGTDTMVTPLDAGGVMDIQEENAILNKMVLRMRTVHSWSRHQQQIAHCKELSALQADLDASRARGLELQMTAEGEVASLTQQVLAMQKNLQRTERECEVVKHSLTEERHRKPPPAKSSAKAQESAKAKTAGKAQDSKLSEKLRLELEGKDKQLRTLSEEQQRLQREIEVDQNRTSRTLQQVRGQLTQERTLKHNAFQQVDQLLTQVRDYEQHQRSSLRSSLHSVQRSMPQATASAPRLSSRPPGSARRESRPQSQQQHGRPRTTEDGEMIDLSQEILALKLI